MKEIIINNKKFSISETNYGWWEVVSRGLWEPCTFKILDKFVEKDDVCIDLGAWFGFISLYCAQIAAEVHSIEPDKIAFEDLQKTVNFTEKKEKIRLYNLAISNYDGILQLGNPNKLGDSMTRCNQIKNLFDINCFTLSSFCNFNNIKKVNFLKIDIEGSEEFLLQDFSFFEKFRPTTYIQLHQMWLTDLIKAEKNFKKILDLYTYVYDENFNQIKEPTLGLSSCILTNKTIL